jgi:lipid II:glycine glycyltransferase (peptidoglycan interpeptide bridge formation enzyme)
MVENDEAFLVTSELEGAVVSASLFQLSADDCLYGVAASDRRLFEDRKPIGHASMWEAMRYAKQRGRSRFVVGLQKWTNDKEANIAKFKRSFGGRFVEELLIELRHKEA